MSTLVKGKTAKETTVVSVVKMISFIFDQGGDAVVILDKIRQGVITAAQRTFTEVIQIEISGGRRMDCPFLESGLCFLACSKMSVFRNSSEKERKSSWLLIRRGVSTTRALYWET